MDRPLYPFTAVVGQERAKQALLCLAVEPRIGGVLLCGEKGTAKSTLVRALGGLEGVRLLELPVSATEDMLLGGVELETAVRTGRRTFQPGLLARADGAVLYADEVNLLPSALTAALLDTLETGVCRMERDGISHTCPARFALVGTMNPEEGTLRPQLLDRFGLYVAVTGEREPEARKEVVRRRLAFEENPAAFRAQWARREERLAGQLAAARALLPQVDVGEAEEQAACLLARQANAAGHRAELAILHTARALAALAGRTYINLEDLHTAAELALPVIVHDREAHQDCLEVVRAHPEVRGVYHCYSGSLEDAKVLVKLGWMLSFTGVITYKNARKALEVIEWLPMDRIMVETDSPYLTPEPFRGKRNDSGKVHLVAEAIARVKGMDPEEAARITLENGTRFFRIEF